MSFGSDVETRKRVRVCIVEVWTMRGDANSGLHGLVETEARDVIKREAR